MSEIQVVVIGLAILCLCYIVLVHSDDWYIRYPVNIFTFFIFINSVSSVVDNKKEVTRQLVEGLVHKYQLIDEVDKELSYLYRIDKELREVDLNANTHLVHSKEIRTRLENEIQKATDHLDKLDSEIAWAAKWLWWTDKEEFGKVVLKHINKLIKQESE